MKDDTLFDKTSLKFVQGYLNVDNSVEKMSCIILIEI